MHGSTERCRSTTPLLSLPLEARLAGQLKKKKKKEQSRGGKNLRFLKGSGGLGPMGADRRCLKMGRIQKGRSERGEGKRAPGFLARPAKVPAFAFNSIAFSPGGIFILFYFTCGGRGAAAYAGWLASSDSGSASATETGPAQQSAPFRRAVQNLLEFRPSSKYYD